MISLLVAAQDPHRQARFWSTLLDWQQDDVTVRPRDDLAVPVRFFPTDQPKTRPNRIHPHLTSDSGEQQRRTVARALELGGRHLDVGQEPEEGHIVLADPEGNEFCVIEPGNRFLAGTGFVGELACDGTREVGLFWSAALGWPLIWDQDEETAIQSPHGGTKIAWGGPPVTPRARPDRVFFEIEGDRDRLIELGATLDDGELLDPDGIPFRLH